MKTLTCLFIMGVGLHLASPAQAQDTETKKIRITVTQSENGDSNTTTREIEASSQEELMELLEREGLLDDITIEGLDDDLEIIVRKRGKGEQDCRINVFSDSDFDFDFDFDFESGGEGMNRYFYGYNANTNAGFLGVHCGEEFEEGVRITKVEEGTAAEEAGLQSGDILRKVNGKAIVGCDGLIEAIQAHEGGDAVTLEYERDGQTNEVDATLQKRNSAPVMRLDVEKLIEEHGLKSDGKNQFFYSFGDGDFEFDDVEIDIDEDAPFLGISFQLTEVNDEPGQLSVVEVFDGSTAAEMGMEKGDILRKIDNKDVSSLQDVRDAVANSEVGKAMKIEVEREGKTQKLSGTLKSRGEVPAANNHFQHKVIRKNIWKSDDEKEIRVIVKMLDLSEDEAKEFSKKSKGEIPRKTSLELEGLRFSPNPNTGIFNLEFELAQPGETSIELYDSAGKNVYKEILPDFEGAYRKKIDISERPNGIYILKVSQNQKHFTQKLVKGN